MFSHNNRTCICCRTQYRYCSSCEEFAHLEPWYAIFHDSNCKEIYNATSMYGQVPVEETKARLDKCDLSNKETFHPAILKVINEVYTNNETISVELDVETLTTEPIAEDDTNISKTLGNNEMVQFSSRVRKKKKN